MAPDTGVGIDVRDLGADDLPGVIRIDGEHTGLEKPVYWRKVFADFLEPGRRPTAIGLGVDGSEGLAGYLLGEVRAVEFGSEPCGWIFAVGVDPGSLRKGIASALLAEATRRFRHMGVEYVRTMVRRNEVPILTFFRAHGFVGGPYAQLELGLTPEVET